MIPLWLLAAPAVVCGMVVGLLVWAVLSARDEARHAEERRCDPGPWLLDTAGYWWVSTDTGGYVRVAPELHPQRITIGPKDPPRPVSRKWVAAEIGIVEMADPRGLPV